MEVLNWGTSAKHLAAAGKEPKTQVTFKETTQGRLLQSIPCPVLATELLPGHRSQNRCPDPALAGAFILWRMLHAGGNYRQPSFVLFVLFCCLQILGKHSRYFPFHQSWGAGIDFQPVIGLLPPWDQNWMVWMEKKKRPKQSKTNLSLAAVS